MTRRSDPSTLAEAKDVVALSVPVAARLVGVSPAKMYQAVATGEVPSVRAFGRILVCAVPFLAMFGVESHVGKTLADLSPSLTSDPAHQCSSCRRRLA
jgi:hypothetical protein